MSVTVNWPERWPYPLRPGPVVGRDAIVATTDRLATGVGVEILAEGGNAVDAAVAVSFALAVVNPEAGNVAGGGYLIVRRADGVTDALDYRSAAPGMARRDLFEGPHRPHDDSEVGHRAVGVPGAVQGLWQAHRRYGRLGWDVLVQPAVGLAAGFPVGERLVRSFTPSIIRGLSRFEASRDVFLPRGSAPATGDTFRQPDLARTLERIRDHGADGFYRGETADLIVAEMDRGGGLVTHGDLQSYRPVWRTPIRFGYRGHHVLSAPPSSSGGLTLAATASILGSFPLSDLAWQGPDHLHLLAESWRRAFADRNHYLADPEFVRLPLEDLRSPEYGRWRSRDIELDHATGSTRVEPGVTAYREWRDQSRGNTTHVSIVDSEGTAVSLTTTLNTWFGCKLVVAGTGVLLNNEMDDFTTRPGVPNHFGLVQGEANAIEPGKRPLSAMTPTIVLDPEERLLLVVGSPGGATIITTVFQVISNIVDYGMDLARAVRAPRVHHQHLPDQLECEPGGLGAEVSTRLLGMGHHLVERGEPIGDVQAVAVAEDGTLLGESDPRRGGAALGS